MKTQLRWMLPLLAVVVSLPASADWLVLESGEEVETRGEWRVEGRRVVYTSERGTLSSVRLTGVDVDASRELTSKKKQEAMAPPTAAVEEAGAEPVLVLTDADFPIQEEATPPPIEGGEEVPELEGDAAVLAAGGEIDVPPSDNLENRPAKQLAGSDAIQVVNWSVRPSGDGQISVLGYLRNNSQLVATAVGLTVALIDADDVTVDSVPAQLSASALMPGVQGFYDAKFPDSINFAYVEFSASSIGLEVNQDDPEAQDLQALQDQ